LALSGASVRTVDPLPAPNDSNAGTLDSLDPEPLEFDRWDLSTRLIEPGSGVPDLLALEPGRVVELDGPAGMGLTRLGLRMIADISQRLPVVLLDVRGWLSPRAAWEAGVDSRNLVVIRCSDRRLWPQVAAAVCEGVTGLYAEVPSGVKDQDLRRLTALIRAR
jgi:hypothetical protein